MRKHFTLIELLTVIVALGILFAITTVNSRETKDKAIITAMKGNYRGVQIAVDRYLMVEESYPTEGALKPVIGKPQPIDFNKLFPGFLKTTPQMGNYWIDQNEIVYGSLASLPTSFHVKDGTATWDMGEDVSEYVIWMNQEAGVEGSIRGNGWTEVKRVRANIGTTTLPVGNADDFYIQAIDRLGFETPPVSYIEPSLTKNEGLEPNGDNYEELGRVVIKEEMGEPVAFVGFDVIESVPTGTRVVYEFSSSDDMDSWSSPKATIEEIPNAKNLKVEIVFERRVGSTEVPIISDAFVRYENMTTGQILTKKTSYRTAIKPIVNLKLLTEGVITQGTPLKWDTSGTFLPDGSPIFNPQYMVSGVRAYGLPNFLRKGDQEVSYSVSDRQGNTTTMTVKVTVLPTDVTWSGNMVSGPYDNTTSLPSTVTQSGRTATWDKNLDGKVMKAWVTSSSTGYTYLEVFSESGQVLMSIGVAPSGGGIPQEKTFQMPVGAKSMKIRTTVGWGGIFGFVDMADKTPPESPRDLSYVSTSTDVTLMWGVSKSDDYEKTEIFREGVRIGTVQKGTNYFTNRSLYSNHEYTYELVAYDSSGNPSEKETFIAKTKPSSDGYDWRGFESAKPFDGDDETYETVRENSNATLVTTEKDMGGKTIRIVAATTNSSSVSVSDRVTYVEFLDAANVSLGMMSFTSPNKVAKNNVIPIGTKSLRIYAKKHVGYIHEIKILE